MFNNKSFKISLWAPQFVVKQFYLHLLRINCLNSYPLHAVIYSPETHVHKKLIQYFQELYVCIKSVCKSGSKDKLQRKEYNSILWAHRNDVGKMRTQLALKWATKFKGSQRNFCNVRIWIETWTCCGRWFSDSALKKGWVTQGLSCLGLHWRDLQGPCTKSQGSRSRWTISIGRGSEQGSFETPQSTEMCGSRRDLR